VRQRAVTQVAIPALAADGSMLAVSRTLVRHRGTSRTDSRHSLFAPEPLEFDDIAVLESQVPQAAAVEVTPAGVQPPRQLVGVPSSADEQRRTHVQRAVAYGRQAVLMLLVVQRQPQRGTVTIDPYMVCSTVCDPRSNEEPLSPATEVEQGVEVAVAELDGEEVGAARTRTGDHHHAVRLDRLEHELDRSTSTGQPLRQSEVRPAGSERDQAHLGVNWSPCCCRRRRRCRRSRLPKPTVDDDVSWTWSHQNKVEKIKFIR